MSERTLHRKTKDGEMPYLKEGASVFYPMKELREWLSARAREQASQLKKDAE